MGHGLKKAECLIFYKMLVLVLGFGFLFPDKYPFIICGLFLLVLWCFTKGYAL